MQKYVVAIAIILLVTAGVFIFKETKEPDWTEEFQHLESDEYHTHADFLVYIDGEQLDLTADKYQTTATQMLSKTVHLHDNQGDVIHFHAENVSLAEFFTSIGFEITNECLTTDEGVSYCTSGNKVLQMYVNAELVSDIPTTELNDEDQKLLYFGEPNPPGLQQYLDEVSDRACIYSGTCPERGTPPPEECGLTCEL